MKIKNKEREKVLKFMQQISQPPVENSQLTWEQYFEEFTHGQEDKKDSKRHKTLRKARSRSIES